MLEDYQKHVEERQALGVVPQPLNAQQVVDLIELIKSAQEQDPRKTQLIDLLENRIPPGVDEAAYVKAAFLADVAKRQINVPLISAEHAVRLLGTMQGGCNNEPLIDLLDDEALADAAVAALSDTLLVFDAFHDVVEKMHKGSAAAKQVVTAWANADWFTKRPPLAEKVTLTVFKVGGETNTDDLSPRKMLGHVRIFLCMRKPC